MAITQPSPSSPLLLNVGGNMPSLNAGTGGGPASGAAPQGGGFYFHFSGSLQAYQEARAGAEAGRILPQDGESLPGASTAKRDVLPEVANAEQSRSPAGADRDEADVSLPDTENILPAGVAPTEETREGGVSQPSGDDLTAVSRPAGTGPSTESGVDQAADVSPNASERLEDGVDRPVRVQDPAQQEAAQASREQDVIKQDAARQAREQHAAQVDQVRQSESQQAQAQQSEQVRQTQQTQQAQQVQQEQVAQAQQRSDEASGQRADTKPDLRQPGSQADAVRQNGNARPESAPETIRATPAQPFPGEGKPAEPAVSAATMRNQASVDAAGDALSRGAGTDMATVDTRSDAVRPVQGLQDSRATAPPDASAVPGDTVSVVHQDGRESVDPELNNAANLQTSHQAGVTSAGSPTSSADGGQDAPVVTPNVLRAGADAGSARSQPEVTTGRADQVVQFSSGNMSDESGEQPSQRQDSQQAQAQAAAANRTQTAAASVSLPQQPFSLAQQQLLSPNWGRAMGERAIMMAQHGPRVAQIQLDPPELGAMQIRIHMQGGDQVSVSFTSANPMVREALEQQMPRLREMFADQGLNLQDSSVADQSHRQQSGQRDQAHQGHGGAGRYGGEVDAGEGMTVQAIKVGLVDYYA